jgi:hypothetical protein
MGSNKRQQFRVGRQGNALQRAATSPVIISEDGRSLRVSLGLLPAPENVYDADAWWVERQAGHIAIYFGQFSGSDHTKLRSRLKIKYPNEAVLHHMWQHSRQYHLDLKEVMKQYPKDPLQIPASDISRLTVESNKEHSSWANFDALARTAGQASIDFYHVAPPAAAKFVKSQDVRDLTPSGVVRVFLNLYQQFEMLEMLEGMVDDVKAMVPADLLFMRPETESDV